jgi:hypothetical protein
MDKKICTFLPESSLWLHTTWEYIVLLLVCGVLCAAYYERDRAAILFLVTSWVSMRPCNDFTKATWNVFRVLELYGQHCSNKGLLPSITVPFSIPLLFHLSANRGKWAHQWAYEKKEKISSLSEIEIAI